MTLKKVYNSKCKHACMYVQQFFANLIFTQIKRTGLWKIYRRFINKKDSRYVLQCKRKKSGERAFNFLQTAYL